MNRSNSLAGAAFPVTAWSQVMQVKSGNEKALEVFCQSYWPAIYSYLRALGCEREEALDETQEFLTQFIHSESLKSLAPERGLLRSYLRQSLRNHIASVRRNAVRQKRGGGYMQIALEDLEAFDAPNEPEAADQWFDRSWAWSAVNRAIGRIEVRYSKRGREKLFAELKVGLISPELLKPYAEIGTIVGMNEGQVKLEVHRIRKRLAEELRAEVMTTLSAGVNVDEELRYLLSVLGHE
jgi:RNA polymerase sigma-70 factor (ECF subfamily)